MHKTIPFALAFLIACPIACSDSADDSDDATTAGNENDDDSASEGQSDDDQGGNGSADDDDAANDTGDDDTADDDGSTDDSDDDTATDDDAGDDDTGGADGNGGAAADDEPSADVCGSYCEAYYAPGCDSGPESVEQCVTFCEGVLASPCAADIEAIAECSAGKEWTCGADGFPTVPGCNPERTAVAECIEGLAAGEDAATDCDAVYAYVVDAAASLGCEDPNEVNTLALCEQLLGSDNPCREAEQAFFDCTAESVDNWECDEQNEITSRDDVCDAERAERDACRESTAGEGASENCQAVYALVTETAASLGCEEPNQANTFAVCEETFGSSSPCAETEQAFFDCAATSVDNWECNEDNEVSTRDDVCGPERAERDACRESSIATDVPPACEELAAFAAETAASLGCMPTDTESFLQGCSMALDPEAPCSGEQGAFFDCLSTSVDNWECDVEENKLSAEDDACPEQNAALEACRETL
jgi:hypothetical protein